MPNNFQSQFSITVHSVSVSYILKFSLDIPIIIQFFDMYAKFCILVIIFKIYKLYSLVPLSEGFWAGPAMSKVVKIYFFDFSYWASSTPWGHVLSLKTFCWNPALSWAIRYSVFQKVKFTSNFEFVCGNLFSTFWHLMVKFGYIRWF